MQKDVPAIPQRNPDAIIGQVGGCGLEERGQRPDVVTKEMGPRGHFDHLFVMLQQEATHFRLVVQM